MQFNVGKKVSLFGCYNYFWVNCGFSLRWLLLLFFCCVFSLCYVFYIWCYVRVIPMFIFLNHLMIVFLINVSAFLISRMSFDIITILFGIYLFYGGKLYALFNCVRSFYYIKSTYLRICVGNRKIILKRLTILRIKSEIT